MVFKKYYYIKFIPIIIQIDNNDEFEINKKCF